MTNKTNYSFEIYYPERSATTTEQRNDVMRTLDTSLADAFSAKDSTAKVVLSDSHKGSDNQLAELTTTLTDAEIEDVLKKFCDQTGLTITALE